MDNAGAGIGKSGRDRRGAPRRRVLKGAQIVSADKLSTLNCTLKSISHTGALIVVPSTADIPDRFYLRSPAQLSLVPCEVVRRSVTSLAVQFLDKADKLVDGL